jgi:hypothetical protein
MQIGWLDPLLVAMQAFLDSLTGAELHVVRSGGVRAGAKGYLQRDLSVQPSSSQPAGSDAFIGM